LTKPGNSNEVSLRVEDCLSAASSADAKEASLELSRLETTDPEEPGNFIASD